jgi:hypothetical protein
MERFLSAYRWNRDRYAWLMGHADVPVGNGLEGLISLMPQENQSNHLSLRWIILISAGKGTVGTANSFRLAVSRLLDVLQTAPGLLVG